jgi:flagellar protein FlaH
MPSLGDNRLANILVAEDVRHIREILADTLTDAGHEVSEASDGGMALEKACQDNPDLILLDIMMPVMDGFEVLRNLRKNPDTHDIPVVLLTAMPPTKGEQEALDLGVTHYMIKPWDEETLQAVVRVALRSSNKAVSGEPGDQEDSTTIRAIRTGGLLSPLEAILGGGILLGSLTLIQGPSAAGKTVVSQAFTYGALQEGYGVGYFSSQHSEEDFAGHMRSIGLRVASSMDDGSLAIYPIQESSPDEDQGPFLTNLAVEIGKHSPQHKLLVVDDITGLATYCRDKALLLAFFSSCKRAAANGATIILTVDPFAFDDDLANRICSLCDTHITLRSEMVAGREFKSAEVRKANQVELHRNNSVSFRVEPKTGLHVAPVSVAKA